MTSDTDSTTVQNVPPLNSSDPLTLPEMPEDPPAYPGHEDYFQHLPPNPYYPASGDFPSARSTNSVLMMQPTAGSLGESILAAQAVNTAISQHGRQPVTVICPFCKSTVLTHTSEVANRNGHPVASEMRKCAFSFGASVFFFLLFMITAAMTGSFIPMTIMPVCIIMSWVIPRVLCRCSSGRNRNPDIRHTCSICKNLLGVYTGTTQQPQQSNCCCN